MYISRNIVIPTISIVFGLFHATCGGGRSDAEAGRGVGTCAATGVGRIAWRSPGTCPLKKDLSI